MLAVVLTDITIYDVKSCKLMDHEVVLFTKVFPKEKLIKLFSEDENTIVTDDLSIEKGKEYHIKTKDGSTVVSLNDSEVIESDHGNCQD